MMHSFTMKHIKILLLFAAVKGRTVSSFVGALCKMLFGGPYFVKLQCGDFKGNSTCWGKQTRTLMPSPSVH